MTILFSFFFFSSRRRHTRCALVTGVQTCALPISRHLVNATGPWAERTAREIMQVEDLPALRLVQGSHIVVERPTSAEDALMIQQPDKRVVFMVPLGDEHLMIGTTETPLSAMPATPSPTRDEIRSEEHTSELQSLMRNSYAVFCLKKK